MAEPEEKKKRPAMADRTNSGLHGLEELCVLPGDRCFTCKESPCLVYTNWNKFKKELIREHGSEWKTLDKEEKGKLMWEKFRHYYHFVLGNADDFIEPMTLDFCVLNQIYNTYPTECNACGCEPCILVQDDRIIHDLAKMKVEHEKTNKECRFFTYKSFISLLYGPLGKGNRKCPPKCVMRFAHHYFPEENSNDYTGFKVKSFESDDED